MAEISRLPAIPHASAAPIIGKPHHSYRDKPFFSLGPQP
jgi:hypothetical protein